MRRTLASPSVAISAKMAAAHFAAVLSASIRTASRGSSLRSVASTSFLRRSVRALRACAAYRIRCNQPPLPPAAAARTRIVWRALGPRRPGWRCRSVGPSPYPTRGLRGLIPAGGEVRALSLSVPDLFRGWCLRDRFTRVRRRAGCARQRLAFRGWYLRDRFTRVRRRAGCARQRLAFRCRPPPGPFAPSGGLRFLGRAGRDHGARAPFGGGRRSTT